MTRAERSRTNKERHRQEQAARERQRLALKDRRARATQQAHRSVRPAYEPERYEGGWWEE